MTEHQFSRSDDSTAESPEGPAANLWRSEVQSRVAGYQTRRGRRVEGAFSMRFPFPADEIVATVANLETVSLLAEASRESSDAVLGLLLPLASHEANEPAQGGSEVLVEEPDAAQNSPVGETSGLAAEPDIVLAPVVDAVPRPRPKRKVIAFPRQPSFVPDTVYRLADPVTSDVPRILDVPEELQAIPTTPFLDGLRLETVKRSDESLYREHVDLPFQAVRVSQRVFAGIVDIIVTGIGAAIFVAVAGGIIPQPSITKPLILASVAMVTLLWSVYQYLFVVYAGRTLGMMAAKIRLRTFKGIAPSLRQRRNRVLGFYLSALSLGMGLMWAFVDVDALCWHDRLSLTYLSNRE